MGLGFVFFCSLIIWLNYQMKNNVGDITYDSSRDDPNFLLCDEQRVHQYYSVGTSYLDERKGIRTSIFDFLERNPIDLKGVSGYVTFRFIVNCNGEIGWFRNKAIDFLYKSMDVGDNSLEVLLKSIENLKDWKPGIYNGQNVDSYYQINFKIDEGVIVDIF